MDASSELTLFAELGAVNFVTIALHRLL